MRWLQAFQIQVTSMRSYAIRIEHRRWWWKRIFIAGIITEQFFTLFSLIFRRLDTWTYPLSRINQLRNSLINNLWIYFIWDLRILYPQKMRKFHSSCRKFLINLAYRFQFKIKSILSHENFSFSLFQERVCYMNRNVEFVLNPARFATLSPKQNFKSKLEWTHLTGNISNSAFHRTNPRAVLFCICSACSLPQLTKIYKKFPRPRGCLGGMNVQLQIWGIHE